MLKLQMLRSCIIFFVEVTVVSFLLVACMADNLDEAVEKLNKAPYLTAPVDSTIDVEESHTLVLTVPASDPEGDTLSFSLGGADATYFSIDGTGKLTFKTAPDFENLPEGGKKGKDENPFLVTVTVSDGHGEPYITLDLKVSVTDFIAGDFDDTFGPNGQGFLAYDLPYVSESGQSVAWTPDGKIVVVGYRSRVFGGDEDLAVWRLQADGSLDPNFGNNGVFTHHNAAGGDSIDIGFGVALTSDSKIVVVGYSVGPYIKGIYTGTHMVVWRLTANGALDTDPTTGFGSPISDTDPTRQGYLTHLTTTGGRDYGRSVALTMDSSGQLDKIVVVGESSSTGGFGDGALAVWRLTAKGALDTDLLTGFGPLSADNTKRQGYLTHNNVAGGNGDDHGRGVALTTDGSGQLDKIVVVGESYAAVLKTGGDMAVWRFTANGSLDTDPMTGFGPLSADNTKRQGYLTHHNAAGGNGGDTGASVTLTTDNSGQIDKIVVVGGSAGPVINGINTGTDLAVWRLTATGALDTSFGVNGVFTHNNTAGGQGKGYANEDYGLDVALTKNNKIVLVGCSDGPVINGFATGRDLAVWRLTANGVLDTDPLTGFGPLSAGNSERQGYLIHNNWVGGGNGASASYNDCGRSVALARDDKIVVVGDIRYAGEDLAVWQIQN